MTELDDNSITTTNSDVSNAVVSPKGTSSSTIIGALTAGGRSMVYQITSFYLRTPVKLFKPARFEYHHYLKTILNGEKTDKPQYPKQRYKSLVQNSSIGILTQALNKYGWKVIPDRVLPPLLINSATGVILYSTYLNTLSYLSSVEPSKDVEQISHNTINIFASGWLAGAAQALVSTPFDAIYTRSTTAEIFESVHKYKNLWNFGLEKLKEIGLVGCYSGFTLALIKESLSYAIYFTTFEVMKGNICQRFVVFLENYRGFKSKLNNLISFKDDTCIDQNTLVSDREKKWISRAFIFAGGVTAAFFLQVIQYPLTKIQKIHFSRLEAFDIYNKSLLKNPNSFENYFQKSTNSLIRGNKNTKLPHLPPFRIYLNSYIDTLLHIHFIHKNTNDLVRWLYKGFTRKTLAVIPGTTAGLLLLDYMKTSLENEQSNS
ncbi:hypothetical protein Kpol_1067p23 [Vanderwaltozyma polyspora DSM 70294]|uniref:Mitochondrial carrier protein n=1 Tax=Vanderwaltozyma polyspora (strain ATCC 22028 / DSM 70294 / BCRC 21397 / CBS 2163 / NBRC 10782 / NRRL Y-8283 / UCD 57-17) TaxID=436907 RepID=A7TNW8_VANPO|nr:uncharacterized protein Kpol_1067p23 [Vanderwaltozyma polyspora DSM 70294]EDO16051.1 hypothetical protein Kpol_1067p23 [Vanderwaltozyma polyspora DSM 70294]